MNKLHWMTRRVIDPVGKLEDDMKYLDFRRRLLLCTTRKYDDFRVCIHDKCVDPLTRARFPSELGEFKTQQVSNKDGAKEHGAWAYLCFCQNIPPEAASAQMQVDIGQVPIREIT